jgi:CRP-like cAMP-binding protein
MEEREYQEGEIILKQGDPSDFVLRIMIGEVEVYTEKDGHEVVLGTVKNNDFLGEMGAIERRPRSAYARAKTKVTAIFFERWEFLRLMSEEASSSYRIIVRLSERLRAVNEKLAEETVLYEEQASGQKKDHETVSLRLFSNSESLRPFIPKEGISINKFPFIVGRSADGTPSPPTSETDLILPDSPPFRLSPQHFSLDYCPEGYVVRDWGSTLGTEVNGEFLGEQFGHDLATLKKGENLIIAGGINSPFVFKVLLEKV